MWYIFALPVRRDTALNCSPSHGRARGKLQTSLTLRSPKTKYLEPETVADLTKVCIGSDVFATSAS